MRPKSDDNVDSCPFLQARAQQDKKMKLINVEDNRYKEITRIIASIILLLWQKKKAIKKI